MAEKQTNPKTKPSNGSIGSSLKGDQPLYDEGTLMLTGPITNDSVHDVIAAIISYSFMPKDERPSHITLFINSVGGDLHAAFALADVIKMSPIPVCTYAVGCVMSAGLMLLMSGAKGGRLITENTVGMSHQFASGNSGKEHELINEQKQFVIYGDLIRNHYRKCTGKSIAFIRKHLLPAHDVYLTAKEIIDYGIADELVKVY
jgi:ATP-dependent Clp endopeptidase proteolytic subunit ClpP